MCNKFKKIALWDLTKFFVKSCTTPTIVVYMYNDPEKNSFKITRANTRICCTFVALGVLYYRYSKSL